MSKIKEFFEIGLASSVYLYVIGFVIVNSYFGLYGIFPDDFINTRYLSAALLFLFSICIFLYALRTLKRDGNNGQIIDIKSYTLLAIMVYGAWVVLFRAHAFRAVFFTNPLYTIALSLGIVLLIVVPNILYVRSKDKSRVSFFLIPQVIFACVFLAPEFAWFIFWNSLTVSLIGRFASRKPVSERPGESGLVRRILIVLTMTVFFIANAVGFGAIIYPLVPANLGGGKAATVSLLLNSADDVEGLDIKLGEDGWSNDLRLIYNGRDSVYVEGLNRTKYSCVEIKEDAIKAIRYTGEYKLTFPEMVRELFSAED